MYDLKSISREANRASRFFCGVLRSPLCRQLFGDLFLFHLQSVVYHLDGALSCLARWKVDNCVEDESAASC